MVCVPVSDLGMTYPLTRRRSWGHFTRKELPNHFAIAEGWTIGDMYQESVIASTNPNRATWVRLEIHQGKGIITLLTCIEQASGAINAPGSPSIVIDNNETPGCEATDLNCYPYEWKTTAEYYTEANVTWQVYQDTDNFE